MHASASGPKSAASFEELKPASQFLILHEDFPAYARAVEVCRRVMEQFGSEVDFDVKCWNFIELADTNCARHAAKTASTADIVLFALRNAQPPAELEQWLDDFFHSRHQPGGVLVLVLNSYENPPLPLERLLLRLEQLSERLDMDFVSLFPGDNMPVNSPPPNAATALLSRANIRN